MFIRTYILFYNTIDIFFYDLKGDILTVYNIYYLYTFIVIVMVYGCNYMCFIDVFIMFKTFNYN